MQRVKLHLSGVKVPKLGSLQDRVFRSYMVKEAQLDAKKTQMAMLTVLTNPQIDDPSKRREWSEAVKKVWSEYLSLLLNTELPEHTEKELEMREYYESVVKKSELRLFKDKVGRLNVDGISKLLKTSS